MNKKMLTITAVAALVGGTASYAATSDDVKSTDKEWVDESAPATSRMSNSVKKFVEAQKSNAQKRKVSLKSDVLGRRGGAQKGSLDYAIKDSDVQKMKVVINDVKTNDIPLPTVSGRYEFNPNTNQKAYWLNGTKVSESEYLSKAEKREKKYNDSKKTFVSPRTAYLTASEIEKELASSETKYITEYKEVEPNLSYGSQDYRDYSYILQKSGVTSYAHNNGVKGRGVGVYYNEGGCPPLSYVNTSYYTRLGTCPGYATHVIGVTRVLQTTAPEAMIYGIDGVNYPTNVSSYAQPIMIGSQSWSFVLDDNGYTSYDAVMDNYIYTNRVVEFVAAGNGGRQSYIGSPSRALNAISVGAVSPVDNMYVSYSSSKNSIALNDKPEVANYTSFRFPGDASYTVSGKTYNGTFNGTSAATPFMAGMTANMLSQHHFLWWHPEVVKALLIAGSKSVENPDYDVDGSSRFLAGIPHYSSFTWSDAYRWRFWQGENNSNFDSNKEIVFTEYSIQKGKHYRLAISWLTSGEYALANKNVAQDIDLSVWQNGTRIKNSASAKNPYELVDFVAPEAGSIEVRIKRFANRSTSEKVILGYAFVKVD